MTDDGKTMHKLKGTAKEHLAGVKGAAKEIQTLSGEHLLRTQDPVRDQPIPSPTPPGP
jgi:hypothetical protein